MMCPHSTRCANLHGPTHIRIHVWVMLGLFGSVVLTKVPGGRSVDAPVEAQGVGVGLAKVCQAGLCAVDCGVAAYAHLLVEVGQHGFDAHLHSVGVAEAADTGQRKSGTRTENNSKIAA